MLRTISNIYIPTEEELIALSSMADNKEKLYDYVIAKSFEENLWTCYQNNRFSEVPLTMMDNFAFEGDLIILKELKKALIRMYPDILYNYDYLNDAEDMQIAIEEFKNDFNNPDIRYGFDVESFDTKRINLNGFLTYFLERVKINLEASPRYRFEYRTYIKESKEITNGILDCLFNGKFNVSNIGFLETLRNVLYVDPMYLTKLCDEEYVKIYKNSGINVSDVKEFRKRDAITFIDKYVNRNKIDGNIWTRNYNREITDKDLRIKIKKIIKRR